jgi:hypothetical protein
MEFFEPDRCYAGQAFFLWGESRLRRDRTVMKEKEKFIEAAVSRRIFFGDLGQVP